VVKAICFVIESSHYFSFHKKNFIGDFAKLGSKNKRCLCFTIIFLMYVSYCFDFWMSKGAHDIFALVINFLNENWQPKKVTIGFFETTK
jgi:hypothetical protein